MSRNDWFDALARDTARGLSRRQMFGRLFAGTGLALFSVFGLKLAAEKNKDCGTLCHVCCENAFPDHGSEYGQCVSDCQHGQGLCGPIVCPEG